MSIHERTGPPTVRIPRQFGPAELRAGRGPGGLPRRPRVERTPPAPRIPISAPEPFQPFGGRDVRPGVPVLPVQAWLPADPDPAPAVPAPRPSPAPPLAGRPPARRATRRSAGVPWDALLRPEPGERRRRQGWPRPSLAGYAIVLAVGVVIGTGAGTGATGGLGGTTGTVADTTPARDRADGADRLPPCGVWRHCG